MKAVAPLFLALLLYAPGVAAQTFELPADQHIDTVEVTSPRDVQKAVDSFVRSYAAPSLVAGKIPKWSRGICPSVAGLTAELNLAVAVLLKQVAGQIGAPVESKEPCDANVTVIFTKTPQALLDDIAAHEPDMLGYHEISQLKGLATMSHPIQAWYATATRDYNGILRADSAQQNPMCATVDMSKVPKDPVELQNFYRYCGGMKVTGNHLNDGLRSEFNGVTIIADFNKISGLGIKSVANYIALLALSQTKAFGTCQKLESIANLLSPDCDSYKADTLTDADNAYLKALYRADPNQMGPAQAGEIARQMAASLTGR